MSITFTMSAMKHNNLGMSTKLTEKSIVIYNSGYMLTTIGNNLLPTRFRFHNDNECN